MAARKTLPPVDLDLDALVREASEERVEFTFRLHGHTFKMATGDDCDFRVMDALAKNELNRAVEYLLGAEQYEKFTSKPVSMAVLKSVLEGWSGHKGVTLGE